MNRRRKIIFTSSIVAVCLMTIIAAAASATKDTPNNKEQAKPAPTSHKEVAKSKPAPEPTPTPTPVVTTPVKVAPQPAKPAPASATPAPAAPQYTTVWGPSTVITAVNGVRSSAGLAPLAENGQLNASARAKAIHMCQNNYWAHNSPSGVTPWSFIQASGYAGTYIGENLAYDFLTVAGTVKSWTKSPTHMANVVGDYTDIGSASIMCPSLQGSTNTIITVNHFGRR